MINRLVIMRLSAKGAKQVILQMSEICKLAREIAVVTGDVNIAHKADKIYSKATGVHDFIVNHLDWSNKR